MHGYEMGDAGGYWTLAGLIVLVVAILIGAWLIARATQGERIRRSTPMEILQERFARGEINADELEKARQALR